MQDDIFSDVPRVARFLFLRLRTGRDPVAALAACPAGEDLIVGVGSRVLSMLGVTIEGMRPMPALSGVGVVVPVTPADLFLRISGEDLGELVHRERAVLRQLDAFEVVDAVDGFRYSSSRDLSGYEDGTENPTGEDALRAALRMDAGPGLDGSSVVAVQRWVHDLDAFDAMGKALQDHAIGREQVSNEELEDAPESAHVKRTAQEDFEPEAFVLRRSMPWRDRRGTGLVFVAFGATLDPFETLLRHMLGLDDGIVDGLFSFTRPVTGCTFWCPPVEDGALDLRALRRTADVR